MFPKQRLIPLPPLPTISVTAVCSFGPFGAGRLAPHPLDKRTHQYVQTPLSVGEIDSVPAELHKAHSLTLARNHISSLRGMTQFSHLQTLCLSFNKYVLEASCEANKRCESESEAAVLSRPARRYRLLLLIGSEKGKLDTQVQRLQTITSFLLLVPLALAQSGGLGAAAAPRAPARHAQVARDRRQPHCDAPG